MATNATTIKNGACWYGLHFGCLNANNPDRRTCAENLTRAENYPTHEATTYSVGTHNDGANDGARFPLRLHGHHVSVFARGA